MVVSFSVCLPLFVFPVYFSCILYCCCLHVPNKSINEYWRVVGRLGGGGEGGSGRARCCHGCTDAFVSGPSTPEVGAVLDDYRAAFAVNQAPARPVGSPPTQNRKPLETLTAPLQSEPAPTSWQSHCARHCFSHKKRKNDIGHKPHWRSRCQGGVSTPPHPQPPSPTPTGL